jgi:hypothetical protein
VEQELDDELEFHLENKIEEGIANGLSPREARYRALRAMDGLEQRKEEMRDMRRIHWLTDFLDDAQYAIRSLRRTPGLTAFVVITLALGIGMTSGTFSMVDALIFRPYPVPHPSGVVTLVSTTHDNGFDDFSYREYLDIRACCSVLPGFKRALTFNSRSSRHVARGTDNAWQAESPGTELEVFFAVSQDSLTCPNFCKTAAAFGASAFRKRTVHRAVTFRPSRSVNARA